MLQWEERSKILSNLLNPAFCGEVLKRYILGYNSNSPIKNIEFSALLFALPILLNKRTREVLPKSSKSHLFTWIDDNEHLFMDFHIKVKDMLPYTREAVMFLMTYDVLKFDSSGNIYLTECTRKLFKGEEEVLEINEILKKAEFLGKWMVKTGDTKSIYSFLRIVP
jgi:hypothetical protein